MLNYPSQQQKKLRRRINSASPPYFNREAMKTCFLSLLVFAVRERLDAVQSVAGVDDRLRAAADRERGSGGIVAVGHLAHRMAALIEGCRSHQRAAGVEVVTLVA